MSLTVALFTAVLAAAASLLLRPVITAYVPATSRWVRSHVHVGLAAAGGFGAAVLVTDNVAVLVGLVLASVGGALLVVIDLAVHRLPDKLVAATTLAVLAALGVAATMDGLWGDLGRSVAAAAVLVAGYFILALISPSGLGLGDVKFAGVIGLVLGWFGWSHVAVGTLLAFLLNGVVALIVLLRTRRAKDTEVPFGPSMVLGAVLALAL